jgi:hypothetical protein
MSSVASVTPVPAKIIARISFEEHRQMRVVIRVVCAALVTFLAAVTGAAAQTSVRKPVTVFDFTFPEEIAGAQRFNVADHESSQPGLGHSAGYRQGNLTGTVYIYDDGKQSIPDDPQSPLVKAQLAAQTHLSSDEPLPGTCRHMAEHSFRFSIPKSFILFQVTSSRPAWTGAGFHQSTPAGRGAADRGSA